MSAEPVSDLWPDPQTHQQTAEQRERTAARDRAAAARDRADRNAGGLSELLDRRPDLRGVHAPADWLEDAIRWTA
jgi:hypothetical protein